MAKVYNIMDKLVNEKPIIEIDEEHKYKINNSKNNAIYIQSLVSKGRNDVDEIKMLDKIIKASLGEEAFKYIETLDLSLDGYNIIVNAIMAGISNLELEEVEEMSKKEMERFQQKKE